MALFNFLKGASKLQGISLGLVIMLIQLFMLVNVKAFFPVYTEEWRTILLVYIGFQATIFAVPDLRSQLFGFSFAQYFPKMLIFAMVGLMLTALVKGATNFQLSYLLEGVPFGVLMVHGFNVSVIEEFFFRGWLAKQIGVLPANVTFGLFHWVVWLASPILIGFGIVLGFALTWAKNKWSPKSHVANMGLHWGYNMGVLGG